MRFRKFFWLSRKQLSAVRKALAGAPTSKVVIKLRRLTKRERKARR